MSSENGNITIEQEDGKPVLVEVGAAIDNMGAHIERLNEKVRLLEELARLQQDSLRLLFTMLGQQKDRNVVRENDGTRRLTN